MNLQRYLARRAALVDRALEKYVPDNPAYPHRLVEAMRYSLFGGGKRIRPILLLAANEVVGGSADDALPFACAVEMIHTYSLIHDDLPTMDDDSVRRGRPTNHLVFGEGLAILAGDALLTEAFRVMAANLGAGRRLRRGVQAMEEIAEAAGVRGMVGGQAADLQAEGSQPDLPTVEFIHVRKTGALILASVRAGAILGGASAAQLRRLSRYGEFLGLAFQVTDDVLDSEAGIAVTGKARGRDRQRRKVTYPAVIGMPAARQRALDLGATAAAAVATLPGAAPLREIARMLVARVADGPVR